jgi:hypothetical protein
MFLLKNFFLSFFSVLPSFVLTDGEDSLKAEEVAGRGRR